MVDNLKVLDLNVPTYWKCPKQGVFTGNHKRKWWRATKTVYCYWFSGSIFLQMVKEPLEYS